MKTLALLFLVVICSNVYAQDDSLSTNMVLHKQLRTTHDLKDWFVPVKDAISGLTAQEASWKDGSGNHSIGELVNHLVFWNERLLIAFKGNDPAAFSGNNEETFDNFNATQWQALVTKIDEIMVEWETLTKESSEEKLRGWYENIANISTHNAYHTGQIVYIRRLQKSWDPARGVK